MNAWQDNHTQLPPEQIVESLVHQIADEAELLSQLQAAFPDASVLRASVVPFALLRRDVLVTIEHPSCSLAQTYRVNL